MWTQSIVTLHKTQHAVGGELEPTGVCCGRGEASEILQWTAAVLTEQNNGQGMVIVSKPPYYKGCIGYMLQWVSEQCKCVVSFNWQELFHQLSLINNQTEARLTNARARRKHKAGKSVCGLTVKIWKWKWNEWLKSENEFTSDTTLVLGLQFVQPLTKSLISPNSFLCWHSRETHTKAGKIMTFSVALKNIPSEDCMLGKHTVQKLPRKITCSSSFINTYS